MRERGDAVSALSTLQTIVVIADEAHRSQYEFGGKVNKSSTTPLPWKRVKGHFSVRLRDSGDLAKAIHHTYDRLPAEIRADLLLEKVWILVPDEPE